MVAFYAANSVGDDIEVYEDDERTTVKQVLHTLRQQEAREEQSEYLAMSDFIAPKGSGVKDYIGLFAVTAGIGMDKLIAKYEADKDDYGKIMAQVSVKSTCFTGTKSTSTDWRTAGARRPSCRGVRRKAAS